MFLKFLATLKTGFQLIIMASLWVVYGEFGSFVGGLAGLWVIWLACRWFVGGFKFYN